MRIRDADTDTMGHGMVVAWRHNGDGGWRRQESTKDKLKVRETIAIVALSQHLIGSLTNTNIAIANTKRSEPNEPSLFEQQSKSH